MANGWAASDYNFCVDFDHKTDPDPGQPALNVPSAMSQAVSGGFMIRPIDETLDNTAYNTFDFGGRVGDVIIH
jgi:hypothetical protein